MKATPQLRFVERPVEMVEHVGMHRIYKNRHILQQWWEPDGSDWHNHAGTSGPEPKGEWRDVPLESVSGVERPK